uniref:Uncharacterized protein n=1 Tax=Cucumis melo TaxID=3656 RepID=A0A9I9ED27_CUCME
MASNQSDSSNPNPKPILPCLGTLIPKWTKPKKLKYTEHRTFAINIEIDFPLVPIPTPHIHIEP